MRFWVHGRGIDEVETLGWIKQPLREMRGWMVAQYETLREQYLMDRLDDAGAGGYDTPPARSNEPSVVQEGGWFGGMFGALKPNVQGPVRGGPSVGRKALPPPGTYTSGEARADFVKVCPVFASSSQSRTNHKRPRKDPTTGTYRLLTLTVDIPSARSAAQRAVVFWADSADVSQEGLLEGSRTRLSW